MKIQTQFILLILLCAGAIVARAQGTAFTYQGKMEQSEIPATTNCT